MNKRKVVILSLLLIVISGCNFPFPKPRDYASEIPFPTSRSYQTQTVEAIHLPTSTNSYIQLIQTPMTVIDGRYQYYAQSGDTLNSVAKHFGVEPNQINSDRPLDPYKMITPGQLLQISDAIGMNYSSDKLLPDSEVIFSPSADDFDIQGYILASGGYLANFQQQVGAELLTGAEIVRRVATNTSVNPRLLLAVIEYRSHWLTSLPATIDHTYPLGFHFSDYRGFYLECSLAAKLLNKGYYGWREGQFTSLNFFNGSAIRIAPQSNAGSVALQYFFAQIYPQSAWEANLYGPDNFLNLYQQLFGDYWQRAESVEPLFSGNLEPPLLELPFTPGEEWALTGGLHVDWNSGTPSGALDFAPLTGEPRCSTSRAWVLSAAPGVVVRSSENIVVIALEDEQMMKTGWQLFYMHIAKQDSIAQGTHVRLDDPIGHPSCEGGLATGTHVHFARKYKGEWIGAGDPLPLVLSGWTALTGEKQFQTSLVKGAQIITASQNAGINSRIIR
jgi:LysM repeat protein/murein DD-endopeptidase MepM/ murein hydrolase activator NlpD